MMIAAIMLASCDNSGTPEPEQEEEEPIYCPDTNNDGNGHLGIGEQCIKDAGECTGLQDYRTAGMKNSGHADYFQWPIYRVGATSHYQGTELTTTVNNILTAFRDSLGSGEKTDLKNSTLKQVHITYNAPSGPLEAVFGKYTWNGKNWGIQKGTSSDIINGVMKAIPQGVLQQVAVLLQPANGIRMANGKKSTEQFPAVAGGDGKLPRAARAATGFELNRQAIVRNNRNVKDQWRLMFYVT